jgi:hypothetical protein
LVPCLEGSGGTGVEVRLGNELVDDYLRFVAARCRPARRPWPAEAAAWPSGSARTPASAAASCHRAIHSCRSPPHACANARVTASDGSSRPAAACYNAEWE